MRLHTRKRRDARDRSDVFKKRAAKSKHRSVLCWFVYTDWVLFTLTSSQAGALESGICTYYDSSRLHEESGNPCGLSLVSNVFA